MAQDRQWRLALANARNAENGTRTRGRVRYESEMRERGEPLAYVCLTRLERRRWEYGARNDPVPTPQHDWRRV